MKLLFSSQKNYGLTRIEVIMIIVVVILLMVFSLLLNAVFQRRSSRIYCISNLKQIALAARIWEGDHGNQYPMVVSITNGGGMEWMATGDIASCFRVMSNELSTTKILVCPFDYQRKPATDFAAGFDDSHISYFFNIDASEAYPQQLFMGDANLATNGVPLKSGIFDLPGNSLVSWTKVRHRFVGNISFADGSVAEESALGLQNALVYSTNGTPFTYNRYAIP